ncbi:hypothetical protein HUW51_23355 [Adhaeribacter swui]|uniref:Uncharacterized protein n=1 Tax=Adhaeribacter swui TaxID=2086471 RepID=A0A7G7GEB7_9BACT|nr:hypothetical protein [Adhaeribacter swui]QNF35501.1 hypothetical protein HUW51_23355 [Adhaeribacter swui]
MKSHYLGEEVKVSFVNQRALRQSCVLDCAGEQGRGNWSAGGTKVGAVNELGL